MLRIEDSVLGPEILSIINNENSGVKYLGNKVVIHTAELDIDVLMLESIEIMHDYNNNVSDYVIATFFIEMGDYVRDIYPFRDNLQISISINVHGEMITTRYKLVILNNDLDNNASMVNVASRDELNKLKLSRVIGQCIDNLTEVMRLQSVSGVYHNTTVDKLISSAISTSLENIKINGVKPIVKIDIEKPDNDRTYNHITIPTGTMILDLPTYLQYTKYGVYNANIGTYVSNITDKKGNTEYRIYVYPLYSNLLFDKREKKLIIYATNNIMYESVEHTYLVDGDVVKIVAGSSVRAVDNSENDMLNSGSGYTTVDTTSAINRGVVVGDAGVEVDQKTINNGAITKQDVGGGNLTRHIGPEDNLYKYRSDIVKTTMMIYQIQWNHCNPSLIFPNMPVQYTYLDNYENIIKLKGTVQHFYVMYNEGTKTVSAIINIAVEKPYIYYETTLRDSKTYKIRAGV